MKSTTKVLHATPDISPARWLWKVARILVTITLGYWVIQKLNWDQVWASVLTAKLHWLALAFCYPFLNIAIDAVRWRALLQGIGRYSAWNKLFRINLVGMFFDNFLPGTIGSDTYRTLCLSRQYATRDVLATVVMGRVFGWFGLLVFGLIGLLILQGHLLTDVFWNSLFLLGGGLGIMIIGFSLLTTFQPGQANCWYNRVLGRWEHLTHFIQVIKRLLTFNILFLGVSLSFLVHAVVITAIVVIAKAYGVSPEQLFLVACVAPLGLIATMLPISIAGHGVRETAFIYFLSNLGIVPEVALTISVTLYLTVALASLIGGGMYLSNSITQKTNIKYAKTGYAMRPS